MIRPPVSSASSCWWDLKKRPRGIGHGFRQLRQFKGFLAAMLFGAATTVPMCIYLFDAQDQGTFWSVYPRWLLGGNGLFLAASGVVCLFHRLGRQRSDRSIAKTEPDALKGHTTAFLWIMCPLAILICDAGAGDVAGGSGNEF